MKEFNDMFGGAFGDIFGGLGKETETVQSYSHPRVDLNIAKIYTFTKTISEIKLKPTRRNTYVIVDCNSTILEEFDEVIEAKLRFIQIVLGE